MVFQITIANFIFQSAVKYRNVCVIFVLCMTAANTLAWLFSAFYDS